MQNQVVDIQDIVNSIKLTKAEKTLVNVKDISNIEIGCLNGLELSFKYNLKDKVVDVEQTYKVKVKCAEKLESLLCLLNKDERIKVDNFIINYYSGLVSYSAGFNGNDIILDYLLCIKDTLRPYELKSIIHTAYCNNTRKDKLTILIKKYEEVKPEYVISKVIDGKHQIVTDTDHTLSYVHKIGNIAGPSFSGLLSTPNVNFDIQIEGNKIGVMAWNDEMKYLTSELNIKNHIMFTRNDIVNGFHNTINLSPVKGRVTFLSTICQNISALMSNTECEATKNTGDVLVNLVNNNLHLVSKEDLLFLYISITSNETIIERYMNILNHMIKSYILKAVSTLEQFLSFRDIEFSIESDSNGNYLFIGKHKTDESLYYKLPLQYLHTVIEHYGTIGNSDILLTIVLDMLKYNKLPLENSMETFRDIVGKLLLTINLASLDKILEFKKELMQMMTLVEDNERLSYLLIILKKHKGYAKYNLDKFLNAERDNSDNLCCNVIVNNEIIVFSIHSSNEPGKVHTIVHGDNISIDSIYYNSIKYKELNGNEYEEMKDLMVKTYLNIIKEFKYNHSLTFTVLANKFIIPSFFNLTFKYLDFKAIILLYTILLDVKDKSIGQNNLLRDLESKYNDLTIEAKGTIDTINKVDTLPMSIVEFTNILEYENRLEIFFTNTENNSKNVLTLTNGKDLGKKLVTIGNAMKLYRLILSLYGYKFISFGNNILPYMLGYLLRFYNEFKTYNEDHKDMFHVLLGVTQPISFTTEQARRFVSMLDKDSITPTNVEYQLDGLLFTYLLDNKLYVRVYFDSLDSFKRIYYRSVVEDLMNSLFTKFEVFEKSDITNKYISLTLLSLMVNLPILNNYQISPEDLDTIRHYVKTITDEILKVDCILHRFGLDVCTIDTDLDNIKDSYFGDENFDSDLD